MRIAIVVVEGSLQSAVTGLADMFWMTSQAVKAPPTGTLLTSGTRRPIAFKTIIVSADGKPVKDAQGRLIPVDASFDEVTGCDVALVTGMALGQDGLPPASNSFAAAASWLSRLSERGVLVGAACAGTFVLGAAGLLKGRRCTTTWWLHHVFKQRFPEATLIWGTALEEHDGIITTGGPLSWVDLALHVIRMKAGPAVAKLAADVAVTDILPLPQAIYAPRGFMNVSAPLLLEAEQIVRRGGLGLTAERLAEELHLSERTLHRRLKGLTNESPKEFITRVRMEMACVLLDSPGTSIKQVAARCGYGDESSFRRAFNQLMGMTASEYRRWSAQRNQNS